MATARGTSNGRLCSSTSGLTGALKKLICHPRRSALRRFQSAKKCPDCGSPRKHAKGSQDEGRSLSLANEMAAARALPIRRALLPRSAAPFRRCPCTRCAHMHHSGLTPQSWRRRGTNVSLPGMTLATSLVGEKKKATELKRKRPRSKSTRRAPGKVHSLRARELNHPTPLHLELPAGPHPDALIFHVVPRAAAWLHEDITALLPARGCRLSWARSPYSSPAAAPAAWPCAVCAPPVELSVCNQVPKCPPENAQEPMLRSCAALTQSFELQL